jgi:hypothetical protein
MAVITRKLHHYNQPFSPIFRYSFIGLVLGFVLAALTHTHTLYTQTNTQHTHTHTRTTTEFLIDRARCPPDTPMARTFAYSGLANLAGTKDRRLHAAGIVPLGLSICEEDGVDVESDRNLQRMYCAVLLLCNLIENYRPEMYIHLANQASNDVESFLARLFPLVLASGNNHQFVRLTSRLIGDLVYGSSPENEVVLQSLLLQEHLEIQKVVMFALETCKDDARTCYTSLQTVYFLRTAKSLWLREGFSLELLHEIQARHESDDQVQRGAAFLVPFFADGVGGEGNVQ